MKRLSTKRDGLLNFSDYKTIGNKIAYGVFIFLLIIHPTQTKQYI